MAIIIPSKNIYDIDNQKVIDNLIDNVSVEQTIVNENREYDVPIYVDKLNNFDVTEGEIEKNSKFASSTASQAYLYTETINYVSGIPLTIKDIITKFFKFADNTLIEEVLSGVDENNNAKIKHTVKYEVYKANITAKATVTTLGTNTYLVSVYDITPFESRQYDKQGDGTKSDINETLEISATVGLTNAHTSLTLEDFTTIKSATINYDETTDEYSSTYTIQVGSILDSLSYNANYVPGVEIPTEKSLTGYSIYNKPVSVEVTFYGRKVTLDLTDGSVSYIKDENGNIVQGKGSKPHSLSDNELLQDSAKVKTIDENGEEIEKPLTEHLANNILNQYPKGKETATLLCDIADYYDENDEKVIDIKTNKMSFRLHDKVIPYVFGANGQDQPMSRYQDGTAKVFEIVGSNIIYDGAVWQELTLLEKK